MAKTTWPTGDPPTRVSRHRWVPWTSVSAGAVAAVVEVLAQVQLPAPSSCVTEGPTPLGTAFAIGAPVESVVGGTHWYNSSVQSAGGGLRLGGVQFALRSASGDRVPFGAGWGVLVTEPPAVTIGEFVWINATGGVWNSGGSASVSSRQSWDLHSGSQDLSGGDWIVTFAGFVGLGTTGCPQIGAATVAIP